MLHKIKSKEIWIRFEYKKRMIRDYMNENLEEFEFFHDKICVLMQLLTVWRICEAC